MHAKSTINNATAWILASVVTGLAFLALGAFPRLFASYWGLLLPLLVATVGVAFADVLADALIVEQGKPLGATGRLQSVAWGAASVATLFTGYLGGYLSARGEYQTAFWVCGWSVVMVLFACVLLREPRRARGPGAVGLRHQCAVLWAEVRSRGFLQVGAFLVLGNLGHFAEGVLYPYMVGPLQLGEQLYGATVTVSTFTSIAACLVYERYCRRVPMSTLVNVSIALACASNLVYLALAGRTSALVVAAAAGFATMMANLIWFDLERVMNSNRTGGLPCGASGN